MTATIDIPTDRAKLGSKLGVLRRALGEATIDGKATAKLSAQIAEIQQQLSALGEAESIKAERDRAAERKERAKMRRMMRENLAAAKDQYLAACDDAEMAATPCRSSSMGVATASISHPDCLQSFRHFTKTFGKN